MTLLNNNILSYVTEHYMYKHEWDWIKWGGVELTSFMKWPGVDNEIWINGMR